MYLTPKTIILYSFDADQTYPLPEQAEGQHYAPLPPVQPPISPAYLSALLRERDLAHAPR